MNFNKTALFKPVPLNPDDEKSQMYCANQVSCDARINR